MVNDPLTALYSLVTRARNVFYDRGIFCSYRPRIPVISVGNLTAGGTGKTPLCLLLVELLKSLGLRPVIITRGYRSQVKRPHVASPQDSAEYIGDEAKLLFDRADAVVLISPDRAMGAKKVENEGLGDVILLDDGFQHRALARDLNILTVDVSSTVSVQAFLDGKLLPFGRFREDRDEAFRRTDAVIFSHRQAMSKPWGVDVRLNALVPGRIRRFESILEADLPKEVSKGDSVVAMCGIANPEGFVKTLKFLGVHVVEQFVFRDHHPYVPADLEAIRRTYPHLPIVCTEKDWTKVRDFTTKGVVSLQVRTVLNDLPSFLEMVRGVV
jgi:tetraacyldisaccharide 4'-kinase